MICQRFSELYSAFLDDALSGEESAVIEEHLRSCLSCRRMAAEVRCIRNELSTLTRRPDRNVDMGVLSAQIVSAIRLEGKSRIQSQKRRDEFFDRLRMRVFSQTVGALVSVLLLLSVTTSVLGPAYRATLDVARAAISVAVVYPVRFDQLEAEFAVPDEVRIKILLMEPTSLPVFNPSGAVLGIGETLSEEDVIFATVQVRNDGRASITQVVEGADAPIPNDRLTDSAAVDKLTNALIQHANFQPARRRPNSTSQAVLMFSKINIQG